MAFEQRDLPVLSKELWDFADSVAGRELKRMRQLWISRLAPDSDGVIRWITANGKSATLSDLAILATLRDMESYRGPDAETSRRNVSTVARVGGTALRHLFDTAYGKNIRMSEPAFTGVTSATTSIYNQLNVDFQTIALANGPDRQATETLARVGGILENGVYRTPQVALVED